MGIRITSPQMGQSVEMPDSLVQIVEHLQELAQMNREVGTKGPPYDEWLDAASEVLFFLGDNYENEITGEDITKVRKALDTLTGAVMSEMYGRIAVYQESDWQQGKSWYDRSTR